MRNVGCQKTISLVLPQVNGKGYNFIAVGSSASNITGESTTGFSWNFQEVSYDTRNNLEHFVDIWDHHLDTGIFAPFKGIRWQKNCG